MQHILLPLSKKKKKQTDRCSIKQTSFERYNFTVEWEVCGKKNGWYLIALFWDQMHGQHEGYVLWDLTFKRNLQTRDGRVSKVAGATLHSNQVQPFLLMKVGIWEAMVCSWSNLSIRACFWKRRHFPHLSVWIHGAPRKVFFLIQIAVRSWF